MWLLRSKRDSLDYSTTSDDPIFIFNPAIMNLIQKGCRGQNMSHDLSRNRAQLWDSESRNPVPCLYAFVDILQYTSITIFVSFFINSYVNSFMSFINTHWKKWMRKLLLAPRPLKKWVALVDRRIKWRKPIPCVATSMKLCTVETLYYGLLKKVKMLVWIHAYKPSQIWYDSIHQIMHF